VSDAPEHGGRRELVALVLAIGLAASLLLIVAAVMYDAVRSDTPGLSENATQILTGWGGGIIGIVGSYLGYRAGETSDARRQTETPAQTSPDAPGSPLPGDPPRDAQM
jgi:hypothetical protein